MAFWDIFGTKEKEDTRTSAGRGGNLFGPNVKPLAPAPIQPVQQEPLAKRYESAPMFKSELYDKVAQSKKVVIDNPVYKTDKLTSSERGALVRTSPLFSDRFDETVKQVKAGKASVQTKQQAAQGEFFRYRSTDEFRWANDAISNLSQDDNSMFSLVKQGRGLLDQYESSSDQEKPRIAGQLYEITNRLQGIQDGTPWRDEYASNPNLMPSLSETFSRYEMQYAPLYDVEKVIGKAEELKGQADWISGVGRPYQSMSDMEKRLFEQEALLSFTLGKKPIDFDMMQEHLKLEQEDVDLYGPAEVIGGRSIPLYKATVDRQKLELSEYRDMLNGMLSKDHGQLGEVARKNVQFELQYIDQQMAQVDGFLYRYETPNIIAAAQAGKEKWDKDYKGIDYLMAYGQETLSDFDARWQKTLSAQPNDKALIEQYEKERKTLAAAQQRQTVGAEVLGYKGKEFDLQIVNLMTAQEQQTYYAYYDSKPDKAHEYALALKPDINKRAAHYLEQARTELAIGNFLQQAAAGVSSVINTIEKVFAPAYIAMSAIRGDAIDPYAASFDAGASQQTLRAQLKENTTVAFGADSFATKALGFGQDVLFGAADSITGGKTLGFMGYMASSSTDIVPSVLLRGGNQDQALAMWAASTAGEVLTEKIPFDNLMGAFKNGFSLKGLVVSVLGEGVGEGLSSLIGSKADQIIMGDISEYDMQVQDLMDNGMSLKQAHKEANKQILTSALYEAAVGAGSGGLSYGIASGISSIQRKDTRNEVDAIRSATDADELSAAIAGTISSYQAGENAPVNETTQMTQAVELQKQAEQAEIERDTVNIPGYVESDIAPVNIENATQQTEVYNGPLHSAQEQRLEQALARQYNIESVPVAELNVSPQEYQFKANVDDAGVHNRIEGEYVPAYAGTVVVHERADGSRYIADGHHRLDRAIKSGVENLQAIILRESEGVSTALARAFAAARNIASSRGTSVDAAKVFKETGVQQQDLYQLGLSPNERNVQEGIALAQVEDGLFERIAQEEIPVKVGVMMGQVFPGDATMQREYWRKVAGRNMTGDAMTELAMNLKNASEIAASQEQVGFDFLDSPALTNAAEKAEVAARVKNMIARITSTFQQLSGGRRVDQVSAVGDNNIDTQANTEQVQVSREASAVMQTYWAESSPAFDIIDKLATAYAEGSTTLAKAAEQAYTGIMHLAKDTISGAKLQQAMTPVENAVQVLMGHFGPQRVGDFMSRLLTSIDGTDYSAQQQTMNNIVQAAMLPQEAQSRAMLDSLMASPEVRIEDIGAFNVAAEQDIADPAFDEARASMDDELRIARLTAQEIASGAMADMEVRGVQLEGSQAQAQSAATAMQAAVQTYDNSKAALAQFMQSLQQTELTPDIVSEHQRLIKEVNNNKAKADKARKAHETAQTSWQAQRNAFEQDYNQKLGEIRARSIDALNNQLQADTSAISPLGDSDPVLDDVPLKTPKNRQLEGVAPMYANQQGSMASVEQDSGGRNLSVNQQQYFKDSKVRDEQGRLLKMYHGTPYGGFTVFRPESYFTQDKEYANRYQNPSASSVRGRYDAASAPETYEVYLNITNPFDTRNAEHRAIFENEFYGKYGNRSPLSERGLPDWVEASDLVEFFEDKGYNFDGLIVDEGGDGGYGADVRLRGASYIAFSPDQIKNVDNTVPSTDPDIRKMYATTMGYIPVSAQQADYKGPVQSAQTIFTKLGKEIGVPFNTNRRQYDRRLRRNTAGYFVTKGETVHVKNAQDITAAAHEYGHFIDKATRIGSHPVISDVVAQLQANPAFASKYTSEQLNGEAVAEVMKMYMVNRDQAIDRLGSGFVTELEAGMRKAGVLDAFDRARTALERTMSAETFEQVKGRIVRADEVSKKKLSDKALELRIRGLDSTLAFDPISKRLRQDLGRDYKASQDPRAIALKNNRIDNFVRANFESGLVDVEGNQILGRGFADNFDGIASGDLKGFEAYLLLYHELDRAKANKSTMGGQFTTEQIQQSIREVETKHPEWRQNKANLHEWYDAFMQTYVVDTGILSQDQYQRMKRMYPNYVPTYRQIESGKGPGGSAVGDVQTGLKAAKASDLNIKSPVESMAQLIIKYTQQAHRLQLANVFADYIDTHDGTGVFAERIQKDMRHNPEMERIRRDVEQMIAQREGVDSIAELSELEAFDAEVLGRLDAAMFSYSDQATGSNVINVLGQDGQYRSYVVHDPNMFTVLQNIPPSRISALLQAGGKVVRLISATATGTNPFFALTNGMRDMSTQMIYGTTSTNFLTAIPKWLLNLPRTAMGALSNTTFMGRQIVPDNRYTEAYRQYALMSETGARFSAEVGRSSKDMVDALTTQSTAKRVRKGALKFVTMQALNEMVENNTRFLEFYAGKSELGKNRKNLDTFEGRLRAGLAAAGVTVDFRRSGSAPIMKEIAAIVPFFNAGVQGINKAASILTTENTGRRAQIIGKAVLNMTMLGVLQAVLNNRDLTDEEKREYDAIDEGFKAKNFFIRVGDEKLLRIPMPQDAVAMFAYALGRVVGGASTGEGGSIGDNLVNAAKAIVGENLSFSTVYSPVQNLIENKTWYGGVIESAQMEKLPMSQRYNERTTEVAKWMSNNIGILSPAQWDYIVPQYTGVWGKLGGNFLRNLSGDAGVDEAFVETMNKELSSRFFTTPAYTSQLYNNFKASVEEFQQIQNVHKYDRAFVMFDPRLTQEELNTAVTEATRMTRKGGLLSDIQEQINTKWDEYGVIIGNERLSDQQREAQSVAIRQQINMLSLQGQNIIADYEAKYFPGTARSNERVIADNLRGLDDREQSANIRDMRAQGVEQAAAMSNTVYADFQAGKGYAKVLNDLATKWGKASYAGAAPSFAWDGLKEADYTASEREAVYKAYNSQLEQGIMASQGKLMSAKSTQDVDNLMQEIRAAATDRAKRQAFGDKYWALNASDYMKVQMQHSTEYSSQSLSVAKQFDDDYLMRTKPSLAWKGFDKDAASPEKLKAIDDTYFDIVAAGLNQQYSAIMAAPNKEAARKIIEKITGRAAQEAKKVALR